MLSIIDQLAATIPSIREQWKDYRVDDPVGRDDPLSVQAGELAQHICDLCQQGRMAELTAFFEALERTYQAALDPRDSNAMYEGFMEALIYRAERAGILFADLYAELAPASRRVWEQHWKYIHDTPWLSV